jgi:hypothetical protein
VFCCNIKLARSWYGGCTLDAWWYNTTANSAGSFGSYGIVTPGPLEEETRIDDNGPVPISVDWAQALTDLFTSYQPRYANYDSIAGYFAFTVSFGLSDIAPEPQALQVNDGTQSSAWNHLNEKQKTAPRFSHRGWPDQ